MVKQILFRIIVIVSLFIILTSEKDSGNIRNYLYVNGIEVGICDSFQVSIIDDFNRCFKPQTRGDFIDTHGLSDDIQYCRVQFSYKEYCIVDTIPSKGIISNDRIIWKWNVDRERGLCYVNVFFPDFGVTIVSKTSGCYNK